MQQQTSTERQRFNQGFWDGVNARGRTYHMDGHTLALADRHFDRVYAEGVRAGFYLVGDAPETSDDAWGQRQSERKTMRDQRRAIKNARPAPAIIV